MGPQNLLFAPAQQKRSVDLLGKKFYDDALIRCGPSGNNWEALGNFLYSPLYSSMLFEINFIFIGILYVKSRETPITAIFETFFISNNV